MIFKIGNTMRLGMTGEKHPMWRGGKKTTDGYVRIYKPDHRYHDSQHYVVNID